MKACTALSTAKAVQVRLPVGIAFPCTFAHIIRHCVAMSANNRAGIFDKGQLRCRGRVQNSVAAALRAVRYQNAAICK